LRLPEGKRWKDGLMATQAMLFVSKRLQRMVFALLCLTVAQLMMSVGEPDRTASAYARTIGQ
jgi:hypothetical protein